MNPDVISPTISSKPVPESAPHLPPILTQAIRALENAVYNEYLNCGKRDDAFADLRALQDTLVNCPRRVQPQ